MERRHESSCKARESWTLIRTLCSTKNTTNRVLVCIRSFFSFFQMSYFFFLKATESKKVLSLARRPLRIRQYKKAVSVYPLNHQFSFQSCHSQGVKKHQKNPLASFIAKVRLFQNFIHCVNAFFALVFGMIFGRNESHH